MSAIEILERKPLKSVINSSETFAKCLKNFDNICNHVVDEFIELLNIENTSFIELREV